MPPKLDAIALIKRETVLDIFADLCYVRTPIIVIDTQEERRIFLASLLVSSVKGNNSCGVYRHGKPQTL